MSKVTRATQMLSGAGIIFSLHTYEYDPNAERIGLQAAEALGEQPDRVFKTLMTLVDGKPACALAPSHREISMKRLAAALGAKVALMMKPVDAERVTGFKVGGISPFGQMRRVATVIEEQALDQEFIYVNGGQRGLQIRLRPQDAIALLDMKVAPIVA